MIGQDPIPSPIPAHRWEKEEQSRKQIGSQELCTPGPGNLWEHESTLHWTFVINGAGYHGELEHSRRLRFLLLLEVRHTQLVLLRPNTECQGGRSWMELSLQEKGKCTLSHPKWSGAHRSQPQMLHPLQWPLSPKALLCTSTCLPGPLGPAAI